MDENSVDHQSFIKTSQWEFDDSFKPLFEYISPRTWELPPPRFHLLASYNASELYRALFLPAFSPQYWITVGNANSPFLEIFSEGEKEVFPISSWKFLAFKLRLYLLNMRSLKPVREGPQLDGICYWLEYIRYPAYNFAGFSCVSKGHSHKIALLFLQLGEEIAANRNACMKERIKDIKSYMPG